MSNTKKLTNQDDIPTRVALLELSIQHINATLERMDRRFESLEEKMDANFHKLDSKFMTLLTLTITGFIGVFGVLAKLGHLI